MVIDTTFWEHNDTVDCLRRHGVKIQVEGCVIEGCLIVSANFHGVQLTPELIGKLGSLHNVRELDMSLTTLDDALLATIAGLRSLQKLDIRHTRVSKSGIDVFMNRRPDCRLVC